MKKTIVSGILLMLCTLSLTAGPAYPGRITYTQPDGTTIGIFLHGDEFGHWATDDAGNVLEQDADGYWRISSVLTRNELGLRQDAAAARRAAANEVRREYAAQKAAAHFGSPKIPVILIGFSDKAFSKTNAQFDAMLNLSGYSDNNAIGSVWDYYNENSFGKFTPQFVVLGPVNLDNAVSYYGGDDSQGEDKLPEMALVHAAQKLDSTVDFSQFDNDGDGTVDFVLFYFAGYDEAQSGNTDQIWSHAWYLSSSSNARNSRTFDGVKLDRYFCTAELKGYSGSTMCSIGTTCHEFAHTLGLPDFYDADYSTNGSAANMYDFDLMANGAYNGNSTTPPYFNAEEVCEIGWLSDIPELTATGSITLPAVNYPGATEYSAYKTKTSVANEYFVYETRRGTRWDAQIPSGLLVYHVDKSTNKVSGSLTAASTWNYNSVNNYSAHPCCYVVPAARPTQTTLYNGSSFLFGGTNYKTYTPTAWDGNTTGFTLTNITYSDGVVTFNVTNSNTLGISGSVLNSDGEPLAGATITFNVEATQNNAPAKASATSGTNQLISKARRLLFPSSSRMNVLAKAAATTVTTGEDGTYLTELEAGTYTVTASLEGYVSQSATVTVSSRIETQNFYLLREGEELPSVLYAWPVEENLDEYIVGSSSSSLTGQNLYPTSEIAPYAGKQIKEFTFYLYGDTSTSYEGVYVIIDYDDERKATIPVNSSDITIGGYTTVDLRELNLVVPSDKDIFAGVGYSKGGYSNNGGYYSIGAFYKTDEDEEGNEFTFDWAVGWPYDGLVSEYNLTATGGRYSWGLVFDFTLTVGDYEAPDTGYNYISDPNNGSYRSGERFEFHLVETTGSRKPAGDITWYYDEEPVSADSITLTSGHHVIEAHFTTQDGTRKVVELEIDVQ